MKDRIIRYSFICLILVVSIMQFSIASQADEQLSNELLAWGFRRGENHEQPFTSVSSPNLIINGNYFLGLYK